MRLRVGWLGALLLLCGAARAESPSALDLAVAANRGPGPDLDARTQDGLAAVLRDKGRARERVAQRIARLRFERGGGAHARLTDRADLQGRLAILSIRGPGETPSALFERRRAFLRTQIAWLTQLIDREAGPDAPDVVDVAQVQAALPEGAALFELASYHAPDAGRRYAAYVLERTGAPVFVDLGPAEPIEVAADHLRAAARDAGRSDVPQQARALADLLIAPVWPSLGRTKRWIIAPDGPLHLVPFEMLVDPEGRWLDDEVTLSYVSAGRGLPALADRVEAGGPPVIVADPSFDLTPDGEAPAPRADDRVGVDLSGLRFPRLPATAHEAAAVAAWLPHARTLLGAAATEAAVKGLRAPVVLHLATHGYFLGAAGPAAGQPGERGMHFAGAGPAPEALEPGLAALVSAGLALAGANGSNAAAGDGILTALEASALDLQGTGLVVLSACETGLGQPEVGEGVVGFRQALAFAGAQSQILTLWKVDDA
ncbi:MAG: CHAT domain-containing protein, partial [Myxococcales bacterium]|nr:CHAT domain-containing protein [Myxococcales bacterium]